MTHLPRETIFAWKEQFASEDDCKRERGNFAVGGAVAMGGAMQEGGAVAMGRREIWVPVTKSLSQGKGRCKGPEQEEAVTGGWSGSCPHWPHPEVQCWPFDTGHRVSHRSTGMYPAGGLQPGSSHPRSSAPGPHSSAWRQLPA